MARPEAKIDLNYYPVEKRHWPLIRSLFAARPGTRILDPFAGGDDPDNGGNFTHWLSSQMGMEGFANELNVDRAASLISLFGESHVVCGAAEHLSTPNVSFPMMWANPPYDSDKEGEGKRLELDLLKHAFKWMQPGGIVAWCVYKSHVTDVAANFLAMRCKDVDLYALPGLHQGTYTQIIAVCTVADAKRPKEERDQVYDKILLQRQDLPVLTLQPEPKYQIPHNAQIQKMYFTSERPDPERVLRLLKGGMNALKLPKLKSLLAPRPALTVQRSIHPPRPGHIALVLGSGVLDGIVIDTEEYGRVMIRAAKERIKTLVAQKTSYGAKSETVVSTFHEKVETTVVLCTRQGKIIELSGDSQVLPFVAKYAKVISQHIKNAFDPVYKFDLGDYRKQINRIRLGDKRQFKLYLPQKHVIAAALKGFEYMRGIALIAEMGSGKAQPLTSKILTPNGWKQMGDMKVGDQVIAVDGAPTTVTGVFPQGLKPVYRVIFSDGSSTECCDEHLWEINTPLRKWKGKPSQVLSLREVMNKPLAHANGNLQNFIPMVEPIQFPERDLPLHPYLLGVLLGDGCFHEHTTTVTLPDDDIRKRISQLLPPGVSLKHSHQLDYRLTTGRQGGAPNPVTTTLRGLGLGNHKAEKKFVPSPYLYSSVEQRLEILRGLLDTDGYANRATIEFVTVSHQLANDVHFLVQSLGGTVSESTKFPTYTHNGEKRVGQLAYRLHLKLPSHIQPFHLSRKANAYYREGKYEPSRAITKIEYIGEREAQCIMVDHPRHLYITDDFIVTHNTALGSSVAYLLPRKKGDVSIIVCPPHLVKKWARELAWMGRSIIRQIDSVKDLFAALREVDTNPNIPAFFIIKRDLTKLGSGFKSAVHWRFRPQPTSHGKKPVHTPTCPTCGAEQRNSKEDLYESAYFENGKRNCIRCYQPLWREARFAGGSYRARLDKVIKMLLKGRLNLLIWDEIHEAKSVDTGNGEAFARLGAVARKVLALTGTPMNGRSSSLYNIEHVLNPETWKQFPRGGSDRVETKERGGMEKIGQRRQIKWPHRDDDFQSARKIFGQSLKQWVDIMGVREYTTVVTNGKDVSTGKNTGTTEKEETNTSTHDEIPGITPDLVGFIMYHTIYLALNDFQQWLPDFDERTEDIPMSWEMSSRYDSTDSDVKAYMKDHRRDAGGIIGLLSSYQEWGLGWPNSPDRTVEIIHIKQNREEKDRRVVVAKCQAIENLITTPKEERLIELVNESLNDNRPCIIYVRQTQTNDIQPRIMKLLQDHAPLAHPFILRSTTTAEQRERIINEKFAAGINVLICHPKLVETGLDLIQFPRIIVYEIIYTLTTLMQAVRRALRLNQTAALCEVIYLYYGGTLEEKAIKLMSTKQRAMNMLLGKLGLTGFDALSADQDDKAMDQNFIKTLASESQVVEVGNQEDMKAIDISDALFWVLNPELGEDDEPEPIVVIEGPVIFAPAPTLSLISRIVPNKAARKKDLPALLPIDDDVSVIVDKTPEPIPTIAPNIPHKTPTPLPPLKPNKPLQLPLF